MRETSNSRVAPQSVRHRLLEGFLTRLAADGDRDAYVLRGGMLIRQWLGADQRRARDVDIVCRLPYDPRDLRGRIARVLGRRAPDGVQLDATRFRLDERWSDGPQPGLRLFAAGRSEGQPSEISVDFTFHINVWPAAIRRPFRTSAGPIDLWQCEPATIVARKLLVTTDLGPAMWRPKDLRDVWRMLETRPPLVSTLGEAVERTFLDPEAFRRIEGLLDAQGWRSARAAGRWARATGLPPTTLPTALADIRRRLRPFLV